MQFLFNLMLYLNRQLTSKAMSGWSVNVSTLSMDRPSNQYSSGKHVPELDISASKAFSTCIPPAKLLLYISNGQEMSMLKNDVNLSKIIFSVL